MEYPVNQYLVILEPHASLCSEIKALKDAFGKKFECPESVTGRPNLTVLQFQQYEMLEKRIIHRMQLVADSQAEFMTELEGFGSLPTHSIFISVSSQARVAALVKAFRPMQADLTIDKERKPHFIANPHIGFARKLLPWQYEKGWLEMSNTHFTGRFMCTRFVLLRKREGEEQFRTAATFIMHGRKEIITQGALF